MSRVCGAKKRSGGACAKPAGWGTDHVGAGRCRFHAGNSPSGRKAAQRELAQRAVAAYGLPREVEPHQALVEELHRTAGHVAWLGEVVAGLDREQLHGPVGGGMGGYPGEERSIWLRLYQDERKHLADVAKTCIMVGVEERRVQLAEQEGQLVANAIRGILTELGVMSRPEVPSVVRRHLELVARSSPDEPA